MWQKLLQSASGITKCDNLFLQSASGITKCDRLLFQRASDITKCDSYCKVRRNKLAVTPAIPQTAMAQQNRKESCENRWFSSMFITYIFRR